jgi:ferrochelatase
MFTAHSLPQRVVDAGDVYPTELADTACLVAGALGRPGPDPSGRPGYTFAYQSAGRTEEPWLGPEILAEIRRLAAGGVTELVVSPVGFIADHLEVLYDIDIEAQGVARPLGILLERPRMLDDDPHLISALAAIVERTLPPVDAAATAATAGR